MGNRTAISFIIFLCLFSFQSFGQTAMGRWRTHFAYNSVSQITQTENKVYGVSDGALFSVDKTDGNIELYSKITGLSGTIISALKYDEKNKQVLICYNNGNIDLMTPGGVINIPDFYNKLMTVDKTIGHITIHNDRAYLSCRFGIIVLDLKKREIAETYYIGPNASEVNVINTTIHGNEIYALAYTGSTPAVSYLLFKADLSNPNLVNYQNWSRIDNLPNGGSELQAAASFGGSLFIQSGWKLYKHENSSWNYFPLPGNEAVVPGISLSNNKMIVANERSLAYIIDENMNITTVQGIVQSAHAAEYDAAADTYWFAAGTQGLISYRLNGETASFKPEGPAVNTPWDMVFAGEKLFVVPGGRWSSFYNHPGYVMIFENGGWLNIGHDQIEPYTGYACKDLVSISVDPFDDKHFFAASYSSGLYEFKNNAFAAAYNHTNSPIGKVNAFDHFTDGTLFDKDGNLWFLNSLAQTKVKVLMRDGTWHGLKYDVYPNKAAQSSLLINKLKPTQKWFLFSREGAIAVFDDNGTIGDQSDDQSKYMSSLYDSDGEYINPGAAFTIAQDKKGVIWVGTDKGPLLFTNTANPFVENYTCSRIKIPRNDGTSQADYLLAEEEIKAIAVDGANRKWLGTKLSGAYLLSEDGKETIHHFTSANSPLLSDEIFSIKINPVTGEVFFATGAGLVSFQSDASEGSSSFENVYVYPNPVRQNFNGVITITGLIENTQVKITDLNGNLICETVSNGSIATWDGKDGYGRKVNTGIYLALCVNEDGTESTAAKIMIIN